MKHKPGYIKKEAEWVRKLRIIISFPHIWTCAIILVCSIISLIIAYVLNVENVFLSSIFSNIFAGLITGFIICLISGIKQISITKMRETKAWLEKVTGMIRDYYDAYASIRKIHFDRFDGDEALFEKIYDCGCRANWVNDEIIQSSFNKVLPFNSISMCKRKFGYDPHMLSDSFEVLHEKLSMIDVNCSSSKEISHYFNEIDTILHKLSSSMHDEIRSLDIRLSEIQKTIV